jgi:hypothetical protein
MVIILTRRFVRSDREEAFLSSYRAQRPTTSPAFRGESLTRVNESPSLPAKLRGFGVNGPACVTYLNIAKWDSWEAAFADQFKGAGDFNPDLETAPRQRLVLDVVVENSN